MDFIQESLQEEGSEFNFGSTTSPSLRDGAAEAFSISCGAEAVNRHLTDIKSVIEFYGFPKKQGKPSGKLATTPFEAFDHNIYRPKALFNGFRSFSDRLPFWILASYRVLYDKMGKNADYSVDWDDKVDDNMVFDHIKCSILDNTKVSLDEHEDPPLKVILRIYFTTSCITIQGLDHEWFSSGIFPQIKGEFNSLLASPSHVTHILPVTVSVRSATSVTNDPVSDSATNNLGMISTFFCKSPVPSRILQPVNVFSPRQVRSPKISHTPQMDFASLESKLTQTLQAFDKLNLENFLSSTEREFNDLVSRIQTIESKLLNTSAHKPVSSVCDTDVLVKELKTLKKDLSSKTATDKELLVSKENQIDILMSELTNKNKEIEKLKKVVSAKGKNSFENDLKDTIILLNEKKTEIKCLNEDLIFTGNKLYQREQDLQLLQNNNMEANEEINLLKDGIYQKEDELDKMRIITLNYRIRYLD